MNNNNMGVWRFAYTGGPDTPDPDPQAIVPATGSDVQFNIGKSGGVSYTWDFGDGTPTVTTTDAVVNHVYESAGSKTATLTVTYADGDTASKTVTAEDVPVPLFTHTPAEVTADVPLVLSLSLGATADFGSLTPSVDRDYTASTTASVIATSAGAQLSVADPSATATGHLVNADYALPSPLKVHATSAKATGGPPADVGSADSPTPLLTYPGATNDAGVTLEFQQHVGVTDALRAGRYSKTLTFTLSTTTP
jgi:PKD repeat protein